ncbi:glutathione-independent formaldehyde dehydrogenase [Cryobacterium sp. CAN_C3]|uniref:glutathione-independent formaldehyde dehydrogenase n=1 Tax=unclassified Cryobacterium TaxID=2649013 RepID=UPI0018CBBCE5|nr:glutathione-independent formaldehyde dehydrogenase [Cryobacterium sp. CAN_C3]MEC5156035.1 glutathione-independent formaldehyde dehydrogenase [Cryobacterium sp. CAN_C3]
MKAVVYRGPNEVSVENVPDAKIERPTDVLVKITSTNICGSDLHMYEGRTDFEIGRTFGHENMGEVIEIGNGVDRVKVGDRVVLPFNISCGFCKNCERGFTNYCLTTQPNPVAAGAAYGFAGMGPYPGGQAEMLRVPYGDHNCLRLGEDAEEKENDYVMLSDIFPTGYHATEMAGVIPGDSVVIYGAGPVGLMAALSATIKGASKVMVVDSHPDRLRLAAEIGAIPIDYSKTDPVQFVLDETKGVGADRGCECVGYQAHDPQGVEDPAMTLNNLIRSVRFTGGIGTVGVFLPADPGGQDEDARQGKIPIQYGLQWLKGQSMGSGQCPVKKYNRQLRDLIAVGKAKPSWIVSHEISLDGAADAYRHFGDRNEGWTKVIIKPQLQNA